MEKRINYNLILFILGIIISLSLFFTHVFKQNIRKLNYLKNNIIFSENTNNKLLSMWGVN